jgi:two-component system, NtrC family, sensor histidine kinase HydH
MSRLTWLFLSVLVVAVGAVVAGAWLLIERDRVALVERFAEERKRTVDEAGRAITAELEDVGEDLRFASHLLATAPGASSSRRELQALVQVVREYRGMAVVGGPGEPDVFIFDATAQDELHRPDIEPVMRRTAQRALRREPGEIETSPPMKAPWLRVFATRVADEPDAPLRAVALLVDLERYFAPARFIATEEDTRLLVLGAHGRPIPGTDAQLRALVEQADQGPGLAGLIAVVQRMRGGADGTVRIDAREASVLGMGSADVIAAFTPVRLKGGAHWSVATLTSTEPLRTLERALVLRLGFAAAAVALLLMAFAAYAFVSTRRTVMLKESRRHAAQLAHLHEKSQKILDHVPTQVLALSASGVVSAVNAAAGKRLDPGAVGAHLPQAFSRAPEGVVARLQALIDQATATGRVRTLPGEELALYGEPGQYTIHAVPLEHPDPEVRALLVLEDLSHLHTLESQLLRAEKLATVGILAAGIAHEVGTPLGVVRGRAEYLMQKLGAAAPGVDGLRVIIEQIDRVSRTIRQLLDFARIQAPTVRPVELSAAAREAAELLRLEAEHRKLVLRVEVPPTLPPLLADPDQLQQVLVNLVMNAFDACEAGGTVTLSAAEHGGAGGLGHQLRLTVQDDGCGIPSDRMNQVFDPFFTTKKRGQGTGLGLTIVAQIARNHGGRIELESTPEVGTRVVLWWPRADNGERNAAA